MKIKHNRKKPNGFTGSMGMNKNAEIIFETIDKNHITSYPKEIKPLEFIKLGKPNGCKCGCLAAMPLIK